MTAPVILASTSVIRASVLRNAGVALECAASGVDEDAVKRTMAGESPAKIAAALADAKALAVSKAREGLVIGADQTLSFEGRLYDKAADPAEARERLRMLRGQPHQLHSAVSAARGGEVFWRTIETATLAMRPFSDDFLDRYLAANEAALSSVGCYQLETEGAQLFERVEGDYFAILGLPLIPVLEMLRREGALAS